MKKYPRESLTELAAVPTFSDPNQGQDADRLVQNMVKYILGGVAPVKDTPQLPPGYWERLQATAERRMTWLAAGSWTWSTPRPTRSRGRGSSWGGKTDSKLVSRMVALSGDSRSRCSGQEELRIQCNVTPTVKRKWS